MTPLHVCAFDLSGKTGWAMKEHGMPVRSGVERLDVRRGESPGMRFIRARRFFQRVIPPGALVFYEQAHQRGGEATDIAVGLQTELVAHCALVGAEHAPAHSATVKAHATGRGKATKAQMVEACKRLGYDPADDNESDAILILHWAMDEYQVPCGPHEAQR